MKKRTKKPASNASPQEQERNRVWHLCVEHKWADAWIGAYWKRTAVTIDVWVCIVPFFPIHWSYWGKRAWWVPSVRPGKSGGCVCGRGCNAK